MMRRSKFVFGILVSALALPALAASGRYAITSDSIASAIAGMGMQVSPAQVTMLTDAVASTPAPHLSVISMQRWPGDRVPGGRMMVRLQCQNPGECVPFFVAVHLSGTSRSQTDFSELPVPAARPRTSQQFAVHAGASATLLLDGDHVHIRVAVTCLQNGASGQTVRAAGPDHLQMYTAQVVGDGLLRGRL